jgi:hypothetical protein
LSETAAGLRVVVVGFHFDFSFVIFSGKLARNLVSPKSLLPNRHAMGICLSVRAFREPKTLVPEGGKGGQNASSRAEKLGR